jgi:hypothetical protein
VIAKAQAVRAASGSAFWSAKKKPSPSRESPQGLLDPAIHIVETKKGKFEPQQFEDQYEDALKDLIRKKQKGVARFGFLFCGDRQVAFVAVELKGLKLTCRHRTIGLATGSDRRNVRGARRGGICFESDPYRLAAPTFTVETVLVDREDFGADATVSPAW